MMGEYAEMMLDGTCCSQCGEFLDANTGYPTLCGGCESVLDAFQIELHPRRGEIGLRDHRRAMRH